MLKIAALMLALPLASICQPVYSIENEPIPKILWLSSAVSEVRSFRQLGATDTPIDTNNLLLDRLPHLKFDFQTVPGARVELMMQSYQYVCATNRLETIQRRKNHIFSQPLNLYMGLRLYTLKENGRMPAKLLNNKGQVISLSVLFEHFSKSRLGISNGRSLGSLLDKQIQTLDPRNVTVHSGFGSLHSLLAMLLKKRVEYVIEFPVELSHSKLKNKTDKLLDSYEIAGSERYFVGHVACKNNKVMKQVIRQINEQLNYLYTTKQFYLAHVNYLHQSDIKQFDSFFKQVFVPSAK